ncbi:hypothetical protein FN846DRAFT_887499 [Sphaerosporella brunnea]|uniref:ORC1/DEAH AAA+ ATPase domain-containing protein n=1 Tax=Sphaerosporella brunnea TaxID=1250544 RepID=A0A5J5F609_9PEZI|nr:hypothetical protein FN846DRAFT_887499 [Sphaerosporella brunnea]
MVEDWRLGVLHWRWLARQAEAAKHDDDFADLPEDAFVGNEAEVVEHDNHFADLPDEVDLVGNKAEDEMGHDNDFADLPADDKLVGRQAVGNGLSRRGEVQGVYLAPINGCSCLNSKRGVQEIATFDKVLLRNRVTSIVCIRMVEGDKTIGWTPGLSEITYGKASLLAVQDAKHPRVLFLCGQSGSGKTWLTRKLLEQLERAQISITSLKGGAATRTIPRPNNKARIVSLTKRRPDMVAKWSRTAKTALIEGCARAVVAFRMDGVLLIDMLGGEEVGDRSEEMRTIKTTNMEMWAIGIRSRKLLGNQELRPPPDNPQLDLPVDLKAQGGHDIDDDDDDGFLPDVVPSPPAPGAAVHRHGPGAGLLRSNREAGFPRPALMLEKTWTVSTTYSRN